MRKWLLIGVFVAGCASPGMDGGDEEEEQQPCDCDVAAFSTGEWGSVRVRVVGNDLLITLPIKGSVKCIRERRAGTCMAKLTVGVPTNGIRLSQAPDSTVIEPREFMPSSACRLNSATDFANTAVFKATFSGGVPRDLGGTVSLAVSLAGCNKNDSRRVNIRIDRRGLDSRGSDYDGDGEPNSTDSEDWDPSVK